MELNSDDTTRRVDIVLDLTCVHSYLGFTRFTRAMSHYRARGGQVEVVFRPFQVAPDASAAGEPLFEVHKRHFGEEMALATARDTSFGADDGLRVNFEHAVYVNTFEAHRLLAAAAGQGLAEQMAERLFRAYLSDGLNIGDRDTLARLAAEVGVELNDDGTAELLAELGRVRGLGIRSVPLFVFDNGVTISGAKPESTYLAALEQAPRPVR